MRRFRIAPAGIWRAFFVSTCFYPAVFAGPAPASLPPPLMQPGKLDPAEGRAALEQMRQLGIAGDYYLEFQLRILPRRGEESFVNGQLWGSRNEIGPVTRVRLVSPASAKTPPTERRLLIQNGPQSSVWRADPNGGVEMLGGASLFEPMVPDTQLTAFDLQMPFIYWNNFSYEGLTRFRGRPAYVLLLRPPPDFAAKHPALTAVRVYLDTQFKALMQTELIGVEGAVTKTLSVVDLKKVDEQWIVKTIDVRDEATRNKTRFNVTAAALGLEFSRTLFQPAQLEEEVHAPAESHLVRIAP